MKHERAIGDKRVWIEKGVEQSEKQAGGMKDAIGGQAEGGQSQRRPCLHYAVPLSLSCPSPVVAIV